MVTIFWRDIPAQVNVKGTDAKRLMPQRFQVAIDRAAMIADMSDTDAYVAQWRQEAKAVSGDPLEAAIAEAGRLDALYPSERLNEFVENGGTDPASNRQQPC